MQEKKHTTKYLFPFVLAMILVVVLAFGLLFMRNFLMKLTIEERSGQLEEMGLMIDDVRQQPNAHTLKCAAIVVSTLPILCVYPFIQKYFVKGVMVGSVKG